MGSPVEMTPECNWVGWAASDWEVSYGSLGNVAPTTFYSGENLVQWYRSNFPSGWQPEGTYCPTPGNLAVIQVASGLASAYQTMAAELHATPTLLGGSRVINGGCAVWGRQLKISLRHVISRPDIYTWRVSGSTTVSWDMSPSCPYQWNRRNAASTITSAVEGTYTSWPSYSGWTAPGIGDIAGFTWFDYYASCSNAYGNLERGSDLASGAVAGLFDVWSQGETVDGASFFVKAGYFQGEWDWGEAAALL